MLTYQLSISVNKTGIDFHMQNQLSVMIFSLYT